MERGCYVRNIPKTNKKTDKPSFLYSLYDVATRPSVHRFLPELRSLKKEINKSRLKKKKKILMGCQSKGTVQRRCSHQMMLDRRSRSMF